MELYLSLWHTKPDEAGTNVGEDRVKEKDSPAHALGLGVSFADCPGLTRLLQVTNLLGDHIRRSARESVVDNPVGEEAK